MTPTGNALETQNRLTEAGILPVLCAQSTDEALRLVEAMVSGGITAMEVTTTMPNAPEVLLRLGREYGSALLLGAGTIRTVEACREALAAGAEFIVSPSLHPEVIEQTLGAGKLMIAGALTPTEIETAWRLGAHAVKVFPCSAMGGAACLRSIRAPFPEIPLLPTGGITLAIARGFLDAGAIALGVGSDLVDAALHDGHPERIRDTARAYCALLAEWRVAATL